MRQTLLVLSALALCTAVGITGAYGQSGPPVPAPPDESRAAKAYAVLATHCARCHQAGTAKSTALTGLENILRLDELARDPSIVRPGLPDASPLYTSLLRRAMPPPSDGTDIKTVGPSPEEIEALRDWIEGLPVKESSACGDRSVGQREMGQAIVGDIGKLPNDVLAWTRYITLPALGTCKNRDELPRWRATVAKIFGFLSMASDAVTPQPRAEGLGLEPDTERLRLLSAMEPIDPGGVVLRVDLTRLGWTAADWERLADAYPHRSLPASAGAERARAATGSIAPVIRADWLASRVRRETAITSRADAAPSSEAAAARAAVQADIAVLARFYERDQSLEDAAAELGLTPAALSEKLAVAPAGVSGPARRLSHGVLPRNALLQLETALAGHAVTAASSPADATPVPVGQSPPGGVDLAIWSDRDIYAKGDNVLLFARASADCYLTLVSVDEAGTATVMFPNDIERDNLLRAGIELRVPGVDAGYRFRASGESKETIVGVCTMPHPIADGIKPDYERQRFTSLGSWRQFLTGALAKAAAAGPDADDDPPPRRSRRARRSKPVVRLPPLKPEQHARTAITFAVRP